MGVVEVNSALFHLLLLYWTQHSCSQEGCWL